MGYVIGILLGLLATGLLVFFFLKKRRKVLVEPAAPLPPTMVELLAENVPYYASLPEEKQPIFAERVNQFLANVTIEGVETEVSEIDKVLVASSAVIPVFAFDDWQYPNLTNVVLYDSTFNEKTFETEGTDRRTMGLVGTGGALQSSMALSKSALLNGFLNKTSKENTGIHEFVHLLDKVDGEIDGAPEMMIPKEHLQPWLRLMHETMQQMETGRTDINPYGLTNEAEFFAVVSEYFFKRPDLLKQKHPELFEQLELIFKQNPVR
ncbi:M90 family metallopeptidase [Fibrella aquatilis]|uniref:Zinc-dependent peptidase n=1 Tax=Fibrella aquatilis TaxID=2817059 RepID=A0A939GAC7_9BACT|nr:M90 family metallopeptidase [Fibrella aquatilis]MBO0934168.1 zinc-dependent peptidase [Fibrella aquatilis]